MEITVEDMRKQQPEKQETLEKALHAAFLNPCQETVFQVCDALATACVYNLSALVPCKMIGADLKYMMFTINSHGTAYLAFTTEAEGKKCNPDALVRIPWHSVLKRALDDARYIGIAIDPYNGESMFVLNKSNLSGILNRSAYLIRHLPEPVRTAAMNGI